jgi:hypothetical protein
MPNSATSRFTITRISNYFSPSFGTLNLRVDGSIPSRLTIFSSALSDGAKYLKNGAVAAVRLNRFPPNATPSGKNKC